MNAIKKLTGIFIVSLFAAACAMTPVKLPEKYNFDNELEEVEEISNIRIDGWQSIDYQSLIIESIGKETFLIILQRPALNLPFSENIALTVSADEVRRGFDNVIVADSTGSESYIIEKVYKIKDQEQARKIKKELKSSK